VSLAQTNLGLVGGDNQKQNKGRTGDGAIGEGRRTRPQGGGGGETGTFCPGRFRPTNQGTGGIKKQKKTAGRFPAGGFTSVNGNRGSDKQRKAMRSRQGGHGDEGGEQKDVFGDRPPTGRRETKKPGRGRSRGKKKADRGAAGGHKEKKGYTKWSSWCFSKKTPGFKNKHKQRRACGDVGGGGEKARNQRGQCRDSRPQAWATGKVASQPKLGRGLFSLSFGVRDRGKKKEAFNWAAKKKAPRRKPKREGGNGGGPRPKPPGAKVGELLARRRKGSGAKGNKNKRQNTRGAKKKKRMGNGASKREKRGGQERPVARGKGAASQVGTFTGKAGRTNQGPTEASQKNHRHPGRGGGGGGGYPRGDVWSFFFPGKEQKKKKKPKAGPSPPGTVGWGGARFGPPHRGLRARGGDEKKRGKKKGKKDERPRAEGGGKRGFSPQFLPTWTNKNGPPFWARLGDRGRMGRRRGTIFVVYWGDGAHTPGRGGHSFWTRQFCMRGQADSGMPPGGAKN